MISLPYSFIDNYKSISRRVGRDVRSKSQALAIPKVCYSSSESAGTARDYPDSGVGRSGRDDGLCMREGSIGSMTESE
jgi:hypothetical protein